MYRGPERYDTSWLYKRHPRRTFLKKVWSVGGAVAAVSTLGIVGYATFQAERGPEVLTGESIDNQLKTLVTDMYGDNFPSLRRKPSLNDNVILGTVEPGIQVNTRRIFGPVYPTNQPAGFQIEAKGRVYGVWFELMDPVPVRRPDGPVELRAGFLAGNFLRKPTQEELPSRQ